jgi:hypothetical protein
MEPLRWSAPEYFEKERSNDWFWGLGLGALLITLVSLYFRNYLFAVLVIISAFSLTLFAIRKPRTIEYELSEKGIRADSLLYPFQSIESFWVEEIHETPKIILASKKFLVPYIVIPIIGHDSKKIRDSLLEHLPEVEHHEPLIYIIAERFGL